MQPMMRSGPNQSVIRQAGEFATGRGKSCRCYPMADDIETNIAGEDSDSQGKDLDYKIARYVNEIELYDRAASKWNERSKKILKIYRDDADGSWELTRAGRK